MNIGSIRKYNWQGKKALIVEDDVAGSFLLSEILAYTKIETQLVETGREAIELCNRDHAIDIVLLDLNTPGGINGYEAARQIRKARKDLPIIAQSAFVSMEDKEKAIRAGCNAHISKPLNTFELLGTMHRLMYRTDELPI